MALSKLAMASRAEPDQPVEGMGHMGMRSCNWLTSLGPGGTKGVSCLLGKGIDHVRTGVGVETNEARDRAGEL